MQVPAEIRVTRRDAGTRSHAGKNQQKPETRTPVTRNYPIPDFSTQNPSLHSYLYSKQKYLYRLRIETHRGRGYMIPTKPQERNFKVCNIFMLIPMQLEKRPA